MLLSETRDDTESSYESYDDSTLVPLISEKEIDMSSSGDQSDAEPMPKNMIEDICDGSQAHLRINGREVRYIIWYRIHHPHLWPM